MRTTITLDEHLGRQVRRTAAAEGLSVSAFIAGVLDNALRRQAVPAQPPFRLVTTRGGRVNPGVDLARPRSLDFDDDQGWFARKP